MSLSTSADEVDRSWAFELVVYMSADFWNYVSAPDRSGTLVCASV